MIGDRWDWWQRLFVPTAPARSKILALDIPTVVTGPRGCGKTMLFRRLSERLMVECGKVADLATYGSFVALYVNANDFADAFAYFPNLPPQTMKRSSRATRTSAFSQISSRCNWLGQANGCSVARMNLWRWYSAGL